MDNAKDWKHDAQMAKKQIFLKDLENLKFQSKSLEREKASHVFIKRGDYHKYYNELEEIEIALNEELKTERTKIDDHLTKIKCKVRNFKEHLKDVKPSPEFVEKLRQTMEDIESTITTFKQQQRKMFESLLTDEGNLAHEIEIIEARIQNLASATVETTSSKPISARTSKGSTLPPEVKAFEGKLSFMRIAVNSIPGRTYEDVKQHEEWYQKYIELQNAKKSAILEWKLRKELEQPITLVSEAEEKERERKKKEKEKREAQERQQKKKELEEWKARKAEQAKLELEEIERNEKRKKQLQEQQQAELKEIRNAARERLRLKKEEEDRKRWRMETEEEEHKAKKAEQAQMEIAKFQIRDQRFLESKQKEKKRKEEEQRMKKERIERARATVRVESDRNRLYRPTDAWIQRKKLLSIKTDNNPAIMMPHRAVPSWRQGL